MEEIEEWKAVDGFETIYLISSFGKILDTRTGEIKGVSSKCSKNTYKHVCLHEPGRYVQRSVHILVALHFIANPFGFPIVNHKDTDRHNNRVSNLEWCTYSFNTLHMIKNVIYKRHADYQSNCSHYFSLYIYKEKPYEDKLHVIKCTDCDLIVNVKHNNVDVTENYILDKHSPYTALYHNYNLPIGKTIEILLKDAYLNKEKQP